MKKQVLKTGFYTKYYKSKRAIFDENIESFFKRFDTDAI